MNEDDIDDGMNESFGDMWTSVAKSFGAGFDILWVIWYWGIVLYVCDMIEYSCITFDIILCGDIVHVKYIIIWIIICTNNNKQSSSHQMPSDI